MTDAAPPQEYPELPKELESEPEYNIHRDDVLVFKMTLKAGVELLNYIQEQETAKRPYDEKHIMKQLIMKYKLVAQRLPLVLQHMCMTKQFSAKFLAAHLENLRKKSERKQDEKEIIRKQVEYELEYVKMIPNITEDQVKKARRDLRDMYYEQLDKRIADTEYATKEKEREDNAVKQIYVNNLMELIKNIKQDEAGPA